ncbi:MAG: hypothetical protein Tsb0021_13120 [Chlamydiales bacterium]
MANQIGQIGADLEDYNTFLLSENALISTGPQDVISSIANDVFYGFCAFFTLLTTPLLSYYLFKIITKDSKYNGPSSPDDRATFAMGVVIINFITSACFFSYSLNNMNSINAKLN